MTLLHHAHIYVGVRVECWRVCTWKAEVSTSYHSSGVINLVPRWDPRVSTCPLLKSLAFYASDGDQTRVLKCV